ncbi:MAG: ribonuclease III [Pseudomonadota bacterium]
MSERHSALLASLESALDYQFSDRSMMLQAFNHRSARGQSNERLEFLGDAILDAVISDRLYQQFPDADEGVLSRLRANLVRDESLAELASALQIGELLRLGPGEMKTGGNRRRSLLSDALEALFAAVYLDGGYAAASHVIDRVFAERLKTLEVTAARKDAKTRLQEYLQGGGFPLPQYELLSTEGPPHKQRFFVSCEVSEPKPTRCEGEGTSRRLAEQRAASAVLDSIAGEATE